MALEVSTMRMSNRTIVIVLVAVAVVLMAAVAMRGQGRGMLARLAPVIHGHR